MGQHSLLPDRRVRIAFAGTCRSGLGHLRRLVSIATRTRSVLPGAEITLVTNAPPAGVPSGELGLFAHVTICAREEMGRAMADGGFDLALVDTVVLPGFAAFGGPAALVLRETPAPLLERFRRDGGRPWDTVIVPNPAGHWSPELGPDFAREVDPVGWILRRAGPRRSGEGAGIVVATGGGGTEETRRPLYALLDSVLSTARRMADPPFRVRQALGPRAAEDALAQADEIFDPGGDLDAVFRAADLVISTAGYNSVLELASTDTPALLAAIPRSLDDQAARVRAWGPRLGHGLDPDRPEEAAAWLADRIDNPRRRAPVELGPDGAMAAARCVERMLCRVS